VICMISQKEKMGIIICDRYHDCAGGEVLFRLEHC